MVWAFGGLGVLGLDLVYDDLDGRLRVKVSCGFGCASPKPSTFSPQP